MKNLLSIFGILKNSNDSLSARVTETGRQVLKFKSDGDKYSATRYPNGTIVETRTIRRKK